MSPPPASMPTLLCRFWGSSRVTSPSLLVLRDVGFCYESEAEVQHRIALDPALPPAERWKAAAASREWYQKSLDTWTTWNRRGAATPESEHERHKVERLLTLADGSPAAADHGRQKS